MTDKPSTHWQITALDIASKAALTFGIVGGLAVLIYAAFAAGGLM